MNRRLLVLPALLLVAVGLVYPVLWILYRGLVSHEGPLGNFRELFQHSFYMHALANTFGTSAIVVLISLVIGFPLAATIARSSGRLRVILLLVLIVPFWTSVLVRAFGWTVMLQRNGLVNKLLMGFGITDAPLALIYNSYGTIIGITHVLLPFMVLPIYSVLIRMNPIYMKAAHTLGAGSLRAFLHVYLPLSMPGVMAGCTLVFIMGLGFYIVPALLGGQRDMMLAQLIFESVAAHGNWGEAGALSILLLAVTCLVLGVAYSVFGVRKLWAAEV
ncbi:MAG: ABC transporter permease [Pseudorhodoplanes sp.]